MITKFWEDLRGYHEIQSFSFQDSYRLVYQINGEVVEDITFPKDQLEGAVQRIIKEYNTPYIKEEELLDEQG